MAKKLQPESKPREETPPIYESDESILRRARERMNDDALVVSPDFRVRNLQTAADLLSQISGYPGADQLYAECRKMLKNAGEEQKKQDYQLAEIHFQEAKEEQEYRRAAAEFRKLSGFEDADAMADKCDKWAGAVNRRFQVRRVIVIAVIAAAALFAFWCVKMRYMAYVGARIEGAGGQYYSAYSRLSKLSGILDSDRQAAKYYELYLRQREGEEQKDLPAAKTGDTVSFGGIEWLVLDAEEDGELTLACTSPEDTEVFRNVAYNAGQKESPAGVLAEGGASGDGAAIREMETEGASENGARTPETEAGGASGDGAAIREMETEGASENGARMPGSGDLSVTWASSSLRRYLNEEVLNGQFTDLERAAMEPMATVPSDNSRYGTDGGEETSDRIRIPDAADIGRYPAIVQNLEADVWLCTPGHDGGSAAYVTQGGTVMLYGDDVADTKLSVSAIVTVDTQRLAAE